MNGLTTMIQDNMKCYRTKLEGEELLMVKKDLECTFFMA